MVPLRPSYREKSTQMAGSSAVTTVHGCIGACHLNSVHPFVHIWMDFNEWIHPQVAGIHECLITHIYKALYTSQPSISSEIARQTVMIRDRED